MTFTAELSLLIATLLLVIVAGKKIYVQFKKVLDARIFSIQSQLEQAQNLQKEAETLLASYQLKHRDALIEAKKILLAAKKDIKALKISTSKDLKETLAKKDLAIQQKIEQTLSESQERVRHKIIEDATGLAQKILLQEVQNQKSDIPSIIDKLSSSMSSKT